MQWNVQNAKAYCFAMRKKICPAKRYNAQHVFRMESVSISVQNVTANGNRKTFLIIGNANQNNVLVLQTFRYKTRF